MVTVEVLYSIGTKMIKYKTSTHKCQCTLDNFLGRGSFPTVSKVNSRLKDIERKVKALYDTFPFCVESDNLLYFTYLRIHFNVTSETPFDILTQTIMNERIKQSTINRVGRKLRESFPDIYYRSEAVKQ